MEIVKFAAVAVIGAVLGALLLVWSTAAVLVLLPAVAGVHRLVERLFAADEPHPRRRAGPLTGPGPPAAVATVSPS